MNAGYVLIGGACLILANIGLVLLWRRFMKSRPRQFGDTDPNRPRPPSKAS